MAILTNQTRPNVPNFDQDETPSLLKPNPNQWKKGIT